MPSKISKSFRQARKSGWFLILVVLLFVGSYFYPVVSQSFYPEKPMTIIVPFGPGGAVDANSTSVGKCFETLLPSANYGSKPCRRRGKCRHGRSFPSQT